MAEDLTEEKYEQFTEYTKGTNKKKKKKIFVFFAIIVINTSKNNNNNNNNNPLSTSCFERQMFSQKHGKSEEKSMNCK